MTTRFNLSENKLFMKIAWIISYNELKMSSIVIKIYLEVMKIFCTSFFPEVLGGIETIFSGVSVLFGSGFGTKSSLTRDQ
jgi:hypothetical protein